MEFIQSEQQRKQTEKKMNKASGICGTTASDLTFMLSESRRKGAKMWNFKDLPVLNHGVLKTPLFHCRDCRFDPWSGCPDGTVVKNPPAKKVVSSIPAWVRKIPGRRRWQSTPIFLPGKFHGQRSLAAYSPWGHKELDTTDQLSMHANIRNSDSACLVAGPKEINK